MSEPQWVPVRQILRMHELGVTYFGGAPGVRDAGLLQSAVDRAPNKFHYGETRLTVLAAAYAYGLARNHPFVDGNKRVALSAMVEFLAKNGVRLVAASSELTAVMLSLASGTIGEPELATWLDTHTEPVAA